MRKILLVIFLIALSIGGGEAIYFFKKGFSPRRIHSLDLPIAENWDHEASSALTQTYRYLGRGRQCFAFESEDGKYVVKLPRTDIFKLPLWARALPLEATREKMRNDRTKRQQFLLDSFQIAFEELKDQTGVLAVHIGQSPSKGKYLTLIDASGCKHQLPLAKTSFVLQYKHPLLMQAFQKALQKGERQKAEKILDALINVIVERGRKGILNRDRSFLRNYGYDGEKAYQIDVGSFFRDEQLYPQIAYWKSVSDSMEAVTEWMADRDPEMVHYINTKLDLANTSLSADRNTPK